MIRLVTLVTALLSLPLPVAADEPAPPSTAAAPRGGGQVVSISPIAWLVEQYGLEYERRISPRLAWTVEAGYAGIRHDETAEVSITGRVLFAAVGVRRFFFREAPGGLYLSGRVGVPYAEIESSDGVEASGAGIALIATTGWSWAFRHVVLRLGLGGSVARVTAIATDDDGNRVERTDQTTAPVLDATLGWRF